MAPKSINAYLSWMSIKWMSLVSVFALHRWWLLLPWAFWKAVMEEGVGEWGTWGSERGYGNEKSTCEGDKWRDNGGITSAFWEEEKKVLFCWSAWTCLFSYNEKDLLWCEPKWEVKMFPRWCDFLCTISFWNNNHGFAAVFKDALLTEGIAQRPRTKHARHPNDDCSIPLRTKSVHFTWKTAIRVFIGNFHN